MPTPPCVSTPSTWTLARQRAPRQGRLRASIARGLEYGRPYPEEACGPHSELSRMLRAWGHRPKETRDAPHRHRRARAPLRRRLEVTLWWCREDDSLLVVVDDARS